MTPAFIMLLVVAVVFLGFGLIPKRKVAEKPPVKSSFSGVAQGAARHNPPAPMKPFPSSVGLPNLGWGKGGSDDASSRGPLS